MKVFGIIDDHKDARQIDMILSRMAASFKVESTEYDQCSNNGGGIGHLCIADLEGGRPRFESGRNLCITVCGRAYDHKKQAHRITEGFGDEKVVETHLLDAESILRYFEKNGKSLTDNLDGTFVIVIWDRIQNKLMIMNDRYGMKPLYYYAAMGKLVFASEVKAIIATDDINKEIEWEGWRDIFSYGYVLGNKTLFRNILSLPPASTLTFKNGTVSVTSYWRYEDIKVDYSKSEEYFVNRGVEVLRNSILKQTRGMNKAQVLLSGGHDSRAIVSSLRSFTNVSFKTLTGILHTSGSKDIEYANLLSRKLCFENMQVLENTDIYRKYFVDMIYLLDGLSFEPLWAMPVTKELTAGIPSFDGIAGDIIFDEVHSLPFDKLRKKFSKKEAVSIIYRKINRGNNKLYRFFISDVQSKIKPTDSSTQNEIRKLMQTDYLFFTFFIRNRTKNSVSLVPNNIISTKTISLFPFLEKDLVQLCMSIPPDMKVKKKIYRKILRKAFPEAMKIPTTRDENLLRVFMHSSAQIAKKILIDYGIIKIFEKLNGRFSKRVKSRLLGNRVLALPPKKEDLFYLENLVKSLDLPPFINQDYLFKEIASHKREKQDYGYFLVPITSFCLWYNLFFKDHPDKPKEIKRKAEQ